MAHREPRDIQHKGQALDRILAAHAEWVLNEEGGQQADLADAKLFGSRLRGAVLAIANLARADLHRSDLQRANLTQAEMSEADLRESNFRETNLTGAVLTRVQLHRADLRGADLREAVLDGSDLIGTNLRGAQLQGASLVGARLYRADLRGADLTGAQLKEAELVEAQLGMARLEGTSLASARLIATDLRGAGLRAVDFSAMRLDQSWFGHTHIADCDLGRIQGLETARHFGPTWLDAATLARSKNVPAVFLYGAGVASTEKGGPRAPDASDPAEIICFIAHAGRDADFAERLRTDLMANSVRCWFLPDDARWEEIELGRPAYDRLLLVCSRNSLQNRVLLRETLHALDREAKESASIVFLLRLDDYLTEGWEHERKAQLRGKPVGDFRNWKDRDLYSAALQRLLITLKEA